MTTREWDLRGARLAGFQYAEWLVINGGREMNFVDEYETDPDRAWAAAEGHGWVCTVRPRSVDACNPPYRSKPYPKLTGKGHLDVEHVRSLRNNPQARAMGCREALLLWLAHEGRGAGSAALMATRDGWRYWDTPFTEDEVNTAARFLHETNLIKGFIYPGGTFMTPSLTASGTQCVEFHDADVRAFLNPQPGGPVTYIQNNDFNGGQGQTAQGENVTQTQNNGIDAESLSAIFKAMRDALSKIEDADDREDVSHAINELEAAAQDGNVEIVQQRAGRLRRLGNHLGVTAGNTAISTATAAGTTGILTAFGLG